MSEKESLYNILEVDKTASQEEIKQSYRKLVKKHHPDKGGDENTFKKISNAYDILSNPEKKAKYENDGMFNDGGFGFNPHSMADELCRRHAESFGFRGGSSRHAQQTKTRRGGDLKIRISLTIHELITGAHKKVKLQREINCPDCSGTGAKNKESIVKCSVCDGTGIVTIRQNTQMGMMIQQYTCQHCGGEGKEIKEKCNSCKGQGMISNSDEVEFDIPAGAVEGINLNINNVGNEARGGGNNGSLIIEITEIEHPIFKKEGNNILTDVFISYYDAVIGNDSLEINTVDGNVKVKIEPGTESGKILRLKGKGIPNINNPSQRGDQMVYVNIFVPKTLTEEERKSITELKNVKSAEPDSEKTQHLKGVYSRIREYDEFH